MNIARRIAKNTLVLTISQIIYVSFGFIYFILMARYLGVEGFGVISFALALSGIFAIFIDLGLYQLTVREVARNKNIFMKYIGNIIPIKVALVVPAFCLMAFLLNLFNYPPQTITVVYFISLSVIFTSFTKMFYSIFAAHEIMEYEAIGQILSSVLLLFGTFVIIHQNYGIIMFAALYVVVSLVILVYSIFITNLKFKRPSIEVNWTFSKSMVKEALPFGFSGVFVAIFYQIDSVMLSIMEGNAAVGFYNAAYRLVLALILIRTVIHSSTFPLFARSYMEQSKEYFEKICTKLFESLFIVMLPIAIGTTILANRIILLFYGAEYLDSAIALQILIWSNVIIFINSYPRLFEVANKPIIFTKITAIGALLNIILNYFMIPIWSFVGASIATVITELIILIISYRLATPTIYNINASRFPKKAISIIISGIIMGLFIQYFYDSNILIIVLVSVMIYICALWITRVFSYSDYLSLKKLISSRNE